MEIFTPQDAARNAGTKYRAILVAARFARMLNEVPRDHQVSWDEEDRRQKLTTLSMESSWRTQKSNGNGSIPWNLQMLPFFIQLT